ERAVVGGLLDDHAVSLGDELPEEEGCRLHRAVRDHDLLRIDAVELRDPLAETRVALPGAIAQRLLPVRLERTGGRLPDGLVGEDVGAGGAPREADRPFGHRRIEYTNGAILSLVGDGGRPAGNAAPTGKLF